MKLTHRPTCSQFSLLLWMTVSKQKNGLAQMTWIRVSRISSAIEKQNQSRQWHSFVTCILNEKNPDQWCCFSAKLGPTKAATKMQQKTTTRNRPKLPSVFPTTGELLSPKIALKSTWKQQLLVTDKNHLDILIFFSSEACLWRILRNIKFGSFSLSLSHSFILSLSLSLSFSLSLYLQNFQRKSEWEMFCLDEQKFNKTLPLLPHLFQWLERKVWRTLSRFIHRSVLTN